MINPVMLLLKRVDLTIFTFVLYKHTVSVPFVFAYIIFELF